MLSPQPTRWFRDRQLDGVQQILIADGLGQKLYRTGLHRPNRHRNIGMPADEDNRKSDVCFGQLLLKIETTASGQSHIQDQASLAVQRGGSEEFLNRAEQLDPQAHLSEEPA